VGHAVAPRDPNRVQVPRGTRSITRTSIPLALLSGALLALSFPRYGHPAVAWVALAPLIAAVAHPGVSRVQAWWLGILAGAVYFGGTIYWTSGVMAQYGGIAWPLAAAIAGLLVAYMAIFPAAWTWTLRVLVDNGGPASLLAAPLAWVATEWLRTVLFGGFPWALLGYTQTTVLPIAQLASVFGVYGVSALIVLVSAALARPVLGPSKGRWQLAIGSALLVAVVAASGQSRVRDAHLTRAGTSLRVGLVQGNVAQDEKWDPALEDEILMRYLRLSGEAADRGAGLVLWPESATPFYFEESHRGQAIRAFARARHTWLLVGSDELAEGPPAVSYNAAFLVDPGGNTRGVYRKVHLVPFGEYVPLRRLLFFAAPLVESVSDFAAGDSVVVLPMGTTGVSTAICYEVVYPALIREGVLAGSQLLTTITNDAWFGRSSAPYQHFEMASMRAIEQGRYLVRAANTGISGIVDPYGRVLQRSRLFTTGVFVGDVRLLSGLTIYARIGDVFAYASLAVTIVAVALARRTRTTIDE
jgi:apolipoprotein N-acyltransferase